MHFIPEDLKVETFYGTQSMNWQTLIYTPMLNWSFPELLSKLCNNVIKIVEALAEMTAMLQNLPVHLHLIWQSLSETILNISDEAGYSLIET